MKLPIPSEPGAVLICTGRLLDRYAPAIARLIVQDLDTLNIVLKLGRTFNDSDSLDRDSYISATIHSDADISNLIFPKTGQ